VKPITMLLGMEPVLCRSDNDDQNYNKRQNYPVALHLHRSHLLELSSVVCNRWRQCTINDLTRLWARDFEDVN
jgi:hypothetical protein